MDDSHRITERKDYLRCYSDGRRFFSTHFVLFVRKRESPDAPWRLGMAVTKKTGCAVWRNRVRRLIKECFRLHQQTMRLGVDLVVVPKKTLNPRTLCLQCVEKDLIPLVQGLAKKM